MQRRTIVMKKCHISVQNADASMLATQMIAPAARKGWTLRTWSAYVP